MQAFPTIIQSWKKLSTAPKWSAPEPETGYIWFDAPLEIGGVTQRGLVLHGGCYKNKPDCNLTFELRVSRTPGRKCVPLMRLDWRSLQGGHSNPRRGNSPWSGRTLSSTHLHDFALNWLPDQDRMLRNLKMAKEIDEDLQSFEDVRSYVGKVFRISNIRVVEPPEWEYDLYAEGP